LSAVAAVGGNGVAEKLAFAAAGGLAADTVVAGAAGGEERDDDLEMTVSASVYSSSHAHKHVALNPHLFRTTVSCSSAPPLPSSSAPTHLIPNTKVVDLVPLLHNLADKLMSADKARRAFQVPSVVVQIAAAQRGGADLKDGIGRPLEVRIGAVFDGDLVKI